MSTANTLFSSTWIYKYGSTMPNNWNKCFYYCKKIHKIKKAQNRKEKLDRITDTETGHSVIEIISIVYAKQINF